MIPEYHTLLERKRLEETTATMMKQSEQQIATVKQQLSQHLEFQMSSLHQIQSLHAGAEGRGDGGSVGGMESSATKALNISGSDLFGSSGAQSSPAQVGKSLLQSDCILHFLAEGGGDRERQRRGGGGGDGDSGDDIERPVRIQDNVVSKLQGQRD